MPRPARLLGLVRLLQGGRAHTIQDIAQHCEISVRTAYRDLAEIQAGHVPLEVTEYGYRVPEVGSRAVVLTDEERALLLVAIANPALQGSPAATKTARRLAEKVADAALVRSSQASPVALANRQRSGKAAQRAFDELARAVRKDRNCEAVYDSLSGGSRRRRRFRPIRLFERSNAWYVAALLSEHAEPRILRLDRLSGLVVTQRATETLPALDLDRWLDDAWDVFKGNDEIDVHLRFDPELRPLIANANHHPGEKVSIDAAGTVDYWVRVSHLDEIARWVVGFGGQAVVVTPGALRERVLELANGVRRRGVRPS